MVTEIDETTLAYVNLFAVLGTLENLCELVPEASRQICNKKPISIGFDVNNGPQGTLYFENGSCRMEEGVYDCTIRLPFSSSKKFNGLIDGTVTPIPSKGFTKIPFLLKTFIPLTELLTRYLRPSQEDLSDPEFAAVSTRLTLYTAAAAIAQIGNHDKSGTFSAGLMPDGDIAIDVQNDIGVTIEVRNHYLRTVKDRCANPMAAMIFSDLVITGKLLSGQASAISCICNGSIAMKGMINMVDNLNRILDRVGQYLS